jgi:hypothetical protein
MSADENSSVKVQPVYFADSPVSATCIDMTCGKVIAVWALDQGIIWKQS